MRLIIFLLILISSATAQRAYYVSPTGNDANSGLTPAAALATINRVNSFTYAAGDSILFQRGGEFYGGIVVPRSNLYYGAYGSGAKPVISGLTNIVNWTASSGKYFANLTADTALNLVLINGVPQSIARRPNADSANGGYIRYGSVNNSTTQIKGNLLGNFVGRKIAIKPNFWTLEKLLITGQRADTFTLAPTFRLTTGGNQGLFPKLPGGYGYFFMDDTAFIDRAGEWVYTNSRLYMALPTDAVQVQAATINTLMNVGNRSNTKIENLTFNGGNFYGIFVNSAMNVNIVNCNIYNIGGQGIGGMRMYSGSGITNCDIKNCLTAGIHFRNSGMDFGGLTITGNKLTDIGTLPGMGSMGQSGDYNGIYTFVPGGHTINNNTISNIGKNGIGWQGNNTDIKYNKLAYCNALLDDGGAIYSFADADYYNRNVVGNFINKASGLPLTGTPGGMAQRVGIYFDGVSGYANIDSNTIVGMPDAGIQCNCDSAVFFRNNLIVMSDSVGHESSRAIKIQQQGSNLVRNMIISLNSIYTRLSGQQQFFYYGGATSGTSLQTNLKTIGIYNSEFSNGNGVYRITGNTYTNYTRANFRNYSGYLSAHVLLPTNASQVVYNDKPVPVTINFSGTKVNSKGITYTNQITIPAYSGELLINR